MSITRCAAVLAIFAAVTAFALNAAWAQSVPVVAVDPPSRTVAPDSGQFEVAVTVDGVETPEGLGGYTLVMQYDPEVLRAVSVADAGFVASTGNAVLCPSSAIDTDAGRLAHLCFTISIFGETGPQAPEPQVLARVVFEPQGEGTTELSLNETSLINPAGDPIESTVQGGSITVGEDEAPPAGTADEAPGGEITQAGDDDGDGGNTWLVAAIVVAVAAVIAVAGAGIAIVMRRSGG